jgi:CBS domain-containing protein
VSPPYLLAQGIIPARAPLRSRPNSPRLKLSDSAQRAMTDFLRDPPLTVDEEISVEQAIDEMFRLGVRALLVVRDRRVVGLMTAAEAARSSPRDRRVAELMTATEDVPAIGWDTLCEARVADLVEIFDGTGVNHLVVLETHSANLSSVRGLIHRERLERQLSSPWSLRAGMM